MKRLSILTLVISLAACGGSRAHRTTVRRPSRLQSLATAAGIEQLAYCGCR
ncbi:MAG: hypothetical protein WCJ30_01390 [Deltaproteobacteria bacterium]